MSQVALSGQDTCVLNNYLFTGFGDGTYAELTFDADVGNVKTGKNGNSIYGFNETGKQATLKLRVLRASADDAFLNNLLAQQQQNFAAFALLQGQFVKKIGDGKGNVTSDTYIVSGGIFTKIPEGKSNAEGDTEQSLAIYTIKFSNAPRILSA